MCQEHSFQNGSVDEAVLPGIITPLSTSSPLKLAVLSARAILHKRNRHIKNAGSGAFQWGLTQGHSFLPFSNIWLPGTSETHDKNYKVLAKTQLYGTKALICTAHTWIHPTVRPRQMTVKSLAPDSLGKGPPPPAPGRLLGPPSCSSRWRRLTHPGPPTGTLGMTSDSWAAAALCPKLWLPTPGVSSILLLPVALVRPPPPCSGPTPAPPPVSSLPASLAPWPPIWSPSWHQWSFLKCKSDRLA